MRQTLICSGIPEILRDMKPGEARVFRREVCRTLSGIGDIVPSIERPAEYLSVNVQGTVAVLEACRAAGVSSSSTLHLPHATAWPRFPPQ